ncbi:hypothetical protein Fmac_013872 [Flemingia macrophylla]|uniref:Uncharacterized protein n=1 Tax=Flemingia macrophylla TaxID=520843 RepID=A0ABD1MA77_9FABA
MQKRSLEHKMEKNEREAYNTRDDLTPQMMTRKSKTRRGTTAGPNSLVVNGKGRYCCEGRPLKFF